jgi:acetyl esterase/lipase
LSERTGTPPVAPELRRRARLVPRPPLRTAFGVRASRTLNELFSRRGTVDGVSLREVSAGPSRLRVFTPTAGAAPRPGEPGRPALLWLHGGGFVYGTPLQDDRFCAVTARDLGVVVVSVGYRLAPEHPFPAAVDDGFAAWAWLRSGAAAALGADPARIAVGGQSAGGGLAACVVQRIHDAGDGDPAAQWLFSPMLDDRTAALRELDGVRHPVWTNALNRIAWGAYLGAPPGGDALPAYAAAARRTALAGLPPAWIGVGSIDLFHDETLAYAAALRAAGVGCTLDVVPGAPHGFESWAVGTATARAYLTRARTWLAGALAARE